MTIKSMPLSKKYLDNYDKIFGGPDPDDGETVPYQPMEEQPDGTIVFTGDPDTVFGAKADGGIPNLDGRRFSVAQGPEPKQLEFDFGREKAYTIDNAKADVTYAMQQWEKLKQECIDDGMLLDPDYKTAEEVRDEWFMNRARAVQAGEDAFKEWTNECADEVYKEKIASAARCNLFLEDDWDEAIAIDEEMGPNEQDEINNAFDIAHTDHCRNLKDTSSKQFDKHGDPITPGAVMHACRHGLNTEIRELSAEDRDETARLRSIDTLEKYADQKYRYSDYEAKEAKIPEWDPDYPNSGGTAPYGKLDEMVDMPSQPEADYPHRYTDDPGHK